MSLQTQKLVMVGLGVEGDVPPNSPNSIQPPLVNGIHLRWAFEPESGFPWYGFYLFRRPSRQGERTCISSSLRELKPGRWTSSEFSSQAGIISSDQNLVLTDDFPPSGQVEFDLDGRSYLSFNLPPGKLAHSVTVTVGFRKEAGSDDKITCVSFLDRKAGKGPNPLDEQKVQFTVLNNKGSLESQSEIIQADTTSGPLSGLACGFTLEITLPAPASAVQLYLTSLTGAAEISVLDGRGGIIDSTNFGGQQNKPERLKLGGKGITRVTIKSSKAKLLLHEFCYGTGNAAPPTRKEAKVTAFMGEVAVAEATPAALPGDVMAATLEADAISHIKLSQTQAALIDVCYESVSDGATAGWSPIREFNYPLCLPVTHPDYPGTGNAPVDQVAAEATALSRKVYPLPVGWVGDTFSELHEMLIKLVAGGPSGPPMDSKTMQVNGIPAPDDPEVALIIPELSILNMVLLASLSPALAQMLGLYWVDQTAPPGQAFDYLIVADYTGQGGRDFTKILSIIQQSGFADLDGYIVFNKRVGQAVPLPAPANPRAYALPGGTLRARDKSLVDASNNAGLRWDVDTDGTSILSPSHPIMYHVWRAYLGNTDLPGSPASFSLITKDAPVIVTVPLDSQAVPQRSPDWPPIPLHYINRGLAEGWYSFQVSGIDIFGRHSPNSASASWYEWTPRPDPVPWYYQEPPGDRSINSTAIRLLDKIPPPPPTGIEAYALDAKDPTVIKDVIYDNWFSSLRGDKKQRRGGEKQLTRDEKEKIIGLRVRWKWPQAHKNQAPDTKEFRIYYHPGMINTLAGRTTAVTSVGNDHSDVTTDISNTRPADAYAGTWLRIGAHSFPVVSSYAGSPLRLKVRNLIFSQRPGMDVPFVLIIPAAYSAGTVSPTSRSRIVSGTGTNWNANLAGQSLRVEGHLGAYKIQSVDSPEQITLERNYCGRTGINMTYDISHPLFTDFAKATNWDERYYVVDYNEDMTEYEVLLPADTDTFRGGLLLEPTPEEPIVYGHVGVSAADYRTHTPDNPKWATGRWGDRTGNEGPVGPPAMVFRVKRDKPIPPVPPVDADRVFATPADYHGHSYYTYRYNWKPTVKTHVFRAMDDAVFKVDWARRPRANLSVSDTGIFPDASIDPRWDSLKRQQVADKLNQLNSFGNDADGTALAMAYYRTLSNDSLRILAGLPGNERAFSQITIQPLDPDDPANADRRGPESPDNYVPDPNLRAYVATLDGRSTNRYFFRAQYVDGAHNRSELSLSGPPVWLKKVVPPRAPVWINVLGGDREITLKWYPNRESDLAEYRIYRTDQEANARDWRLMTRIHTDTVTDGNPMSYPAEKNWVDSVPGGVTQYYRLVAVDTSGNISSPSAVAMGRAFDESCPAPPQWNAIQPGSELGSIELSWTSTQSDLTCLVQQSVKDTNVWINLSSWLPRSIYTFTYNNRESGLVYEYRLRVIDKDGKQNKDFNTIVN
jgi:hypothetical protein